MHTTNYTDTLITVAPGTTVSAAAAPPRGKGTVAERQFELLDGHDYELMSDDVVFTVFCDRHDIAPADREAVRSQFFSKGQPCLRASPLAKSYGWGIHADAQARVALVRMDSDRYQDLLTDEATTKRPAMRVSR